MDPCCLVVSDSSTIKLTRWTHSHMLALQPLSKETKCNVDFITCKQHAGFSHSDVQSFLYNGSQGGIEMTVAWNAFSRALFLIAVRIIDGDLLVFHLLLVLLSSDVLFSVWRGLSDISVYISKPALCCRLMKTKIS